MAATAARNHDAAVLVGVAYRIAYQIRQNALQQQRITGDISGAWPDNQANIFDAGEHLVVCRNTSQHGIHSTGL